MEDNAAFDIDPELLAGFVDEAMEGLETLDSLFVTLEAEPANLDTISSIFRPVHTVKGNSAFFGLMKVKSLAHEMETLLDLAKQEKLVPDQSIIDVLLEGVDSLKEMLSRTREGQDEIAGVEVHLQRALVAHDDRGVPQQAGAAELDHTLAAAGHRDVQQAVRLHTSAVVVPVLEGLGVAKPPGNKVENVDAQVDEHPAARSLASEGEVGFHRPTELIPISDIERLDRAQKPRTDEGLRQA